MMFFRALCLSLQLLVVSSEVYPGQQCPTWFHVPAGAVTNASCECGNNLNDVIECNNVTGEVSIALGYCMTYSNVSGIQQPVVAFTGYVFPRTAVDEGGFMRLPKNITELNDIMCTSRGAKGFLCGNCVSGYGFAVNSIYNQCAKCNTAYAVGMLILCAILPMTIFFVVLVMFRLNIPSGFLFGYIFYCHYYAIAVRTNPAIFYSIMNSMNYIGQAILHVSLFLAGFSWYFMSIFFFLDDICIHHSLSRLQVIFIEYIYFLYPLLLLFFLWLCIELHARNCKLVVFAVKPFYLVLAKIRRNCSVSDSVMHAYASFFFLSFSSLMFFSYVVTETSKVHDMYSNIIKRVVVYEPTIERLSHQHLAYVIPAILLFFCFGICPTLLLCLYTTKLLKKCCTFHPRTQLMLTTFVDVFQSCYKDGLNGTYDFRFLSSFPMVISLLLFSCFPSVTFHSRIHVYATLALLLFLISYFFAFSKPYKSLYMNFSLCFHFAIAGVLVTIISLWHAAHGASNGPLSLFFTIFTCLPHLVAIVTIVYRSLICIPLIKNGMERVSVRCLSFFHRTRGQEFITASLLPDRLENSYAYRN